MLACEWKGSSVKQSSGIQLWSERNSRHVLHDLRHAIVYLNWWFRAMPCAGIWGNLFGTMCCARAALHNKTGHGTQLYIICDSHKAMPSSVLASRSRLASVRAHVRRVSIDLVRFIFNTPSSVTVGILLIAMLLHFCQSHLSVSLVYHLIELHTSVCCGQ